MLNNNQVASIVNEAVAMATGREEISTLDLSAIIDNGNDPTVIGSKEQFTNALTNVISKRWFTDSKYRSDMSDIFFEDSEKFGAIVEAVSIEMPEAKESHAWKDFTPKQGNPATVGVYEVMLPIVHSQLYGKSISYEVQIAITNEQWDTAFHSASELSQFVNYIFVQVDNAMMLHLETMAMANRNDFISEKVQYANSDDATGVHVVNLVELYAKSTGATSEITATAFLNNKEGLNSATEFIKNFVDYVQKPSEAFNTAQYKRFTPKDRLVLQMLGAFENKLLRVATSNTYHDSLVSLPLHRTVPYWEGSGTTFDFESVSSIDVKDANGDITTITGVVGLLVDKWAIMHTIKNHRIASKYFDPEALTLYFYQNRDQYMTNLTMNGIVFVVQDYNPSISA